MRWDTIEKALKMHFAEKIDKTEFLICESLKSQFATLFILDSIANYYKLYKTNPKKTEPLFILVNSILSQVSDASVGTFLNSALFEAIDSHLRRKMNTKEVIDEIESDILGNWFPLFDWNFKYSDLLDRVTLYLLHEQPKSLKNTLIRKIEDLENQVLICEKKNVKKRDKLDMVVYYQSMCEWEDQMGTKDSLVEIEDELVERFEKAKEKVESMIKTPFIDIADFENQHMEDFSNLGNISIDTDLQEENQVYLERLRWEVSILEKKSFMNL